MTGAAARPRGSGHGPQRNKQAKRPQVIQDHADARSARLLKIGIGRSQPAQIAPIRITGGPAADTAGAAPIGYARVLPVGPWSLTVM